MKKVISVVAIVILILMGLASMQAQAAQAAPKGKATAVQPARPASGEWEKLAAEARKEGTLVVVGTSLGATKAAISKAFREKFGVNIQYLDGWGAEVTAKVLAQRSAGLYTVDIGHTGDGTFFEMQPHHITVPLEPFMILPEITDGSKWRGGRIPFIDKEKHIMSFVAMSIPPAIYNMDMVKENEITRNADLLNPKWKGKIVLGDPTITGTGNNWFTHVVTVLHSRDEGLKFMRDFVKQEPLVSRDNRQLVEWVAKGKYPVGVAASMSVTAQFKQLGASIGYGALADRPFISPGPGNMYVFDKAPHPNAAKLYVNWLLSREGAELWVPAHGYPSLRLDVAANNSIDPALIPPKDVSVTKEASYLKLQGDMRTLAKEVFKDLMR